MIALSLCHLCFTLRYCTMCAELTQARVIPPVLRWSPPRTFPLWASSASWTCLEPFRFSVSLLHLYRSFGTVWPFHLRELSPVGGFGVVCAGSGLARKQPSGVYFQYHRHRHHYHHISYLLSQKVDVPFPFTSTCL